MWKFLLSLVIFLVPFQVYAISDPLAVPNNKYGIHIADFNDLPAVADLVNSTGGDWGYVTLVATDGDRDPGKWQSMFDGMRRNHLIPIVRLATHVENAAWVLPNKETLDELVTFFNALRWPIQNRYIILYNEPNHANEWGGIIDPEGYASIALEVARKFKAASPDFFILPAGLDVSAASDGRSLNAADYIRRMVIAEPEFFSVIDGWTSHSYPNPGFSGSPYASGRGSLRSFEWEKTFLRSLGITRELPVFITETGWVHNQGKYPTGTGLSTQTVSDNFVIAANSVWTEKQIAAITPFVFNYQDIPFDTFSFRRLGSSEFYPQYDGYKSVPKIIGRPVQAEMYVLSDPLLPDALIQNSSYSLTAELINRGQGIYDETGGFSIYFDDGGAGFHFLADPIAITEPDHSSGITIHIVTPQKSGTYRVTVGIRKFDTYIPVQTRDIAIVPPPSMTIRTKVGWRTLGNAEHVTALIYDGDTFLQKFTELTMTNGAVVVEGIANIVPGRMYRIVLLTPYYLPRQTIMRLTSGMTDVSMKRLYPLDFNGDGTLSWEDALPLLRQSPNNVIWRFVGF